MNAALSQNLSNTIHGFAKRGHRHPTFDTVANQVVKRPNFIHEFNPQALSNILWSFATVKYSHYQLFEKVGNHIVQLQNLNEFNPQNLSNIVWAYAKTDIAHPQLFQSVGDHFVQLPNLNAFTPQALSITVWAFAKRGYNHNVLFEKVANHFLVQNDLLANYNQQNISLIIWAFSQCQSQLPEFFELLIDQILQRDDLDDLPFSSLMNAVACLNKFTIAPKELMDKVLKAAIERNEINELRRLSETMFPEEKEMCFNPSCTDCEKHHINDVNLMTILLQRRFERLYEEEDIRIEVDEHGAITIDATEAQPPSMPHAQEISYPDDEQQLVHDIEELKKKVKEFLDGKDQDRKSAKQDLSHPDSSLGNAEKARLTAQMNGVSKPKRKFVGENATNHEFSELQYEWLRYKLIVTLIESKDAAEVPLFTEQCVRVLLILCPGDLHVIWVNHCATQYSRGHCNLNGGNGCREGYNMRNCASVIAMMAIAKYFESYTAFKFQDVVEHVQCVNLFEFCLTEGKRFQRCPAGTESQTKPLVGIFNLFLQALSDLKVHTIVASSAGQTCGVEELVLNKLLSPSALITIIRRTLWHLQFNVVQHEARAAEDMGRIMTQQWEMFSRLIMPRLHEAGVSDGVETIAEYLMKNGDIVFITANPTGLEETFVKYFSKEARIESLLQACREAYGDNGDAKVGEQAHIIQAYAQNHWSEIEERLGKDAPNNWHYLTVKEILSNMGKNGWEARLKKYGLEAVVKQLSESGKKGWDARVQKYGREAVVKELSESRQHLSIAGSKGSNASAGVRQEQADENQQILESLVQSGEPFWIRAKKGEITAKKGQPLFRIFRKKALGHFPTIQECHGKSEALTELLYGEIPFGNNEVLDTIILSYVHNYNSKQKLTRCHLRVPFGMLSHSAGNGNVVLAWFQKS
mmetsp:Transcript_12570/g.25042  ORF Transcript_12570/g.25042 Transcript_12570/m.25042 type:complete len:920 (+) Transcript_12570:103-2862(+)